MKELKLTKLNQFNEELTEEELRLGKYQLQSLLATVGVGGTIALVLSQMSKVAMYTFLFVL